MSWNPSSPRYSKNPFMANKNMSTQHRQDIIDLWHQYKKCNAYHKYIALDFYNWLEKNHRHLLSFRCTFSPNKKVIMAICLQNP